MSNAFPYVRRRWPPRQFWIAIGLVFAGQLVLIFWLSDRSAAAVRQPAVAPRFRLDNTKAGPLRELEDPTRFVLPHREGFSGMAWLTVPKREFHFDASPAPPPRWLPLAVAELGMEFIRFSQTNAPPPTTTPILPEPTLIAPKAFPGSFVAVRSTFHFEDDLAKRRLLTKKIELPSWPGPDLLTNSVVQLSVDAQGRTFSLVLLPPGSGSKDADQFALELARTLRFESIEISGPDRPRTTELTSGTMVFEWQTLASTNEPPPPHL